jgi:hypothetical protein
VSALVCDCVLCHFLLPLFPVAAGVLIVIVLFLYCKDRKTKINAQVFAHLFYV